MKTFNMPMFLKTCVVGVNFKKWLQSPVGGEKGDSQVRSVTLQSLNIFEVLLCRCLYIMG